MTKDEYTATQNALIDIGKMAEHLNIQEFLLDIARAETVAPFTDPTLFMHASSNLRAIKTLARSVGVIQGDFKRLLDEVLKTALFENERKESMT